MVIAFVHPDHDCHAVNLNFTQQLRSDGWIISDTHISFLSFGDSISGTCRLIVAVHLNAEDNCHLLEIRTPLQLQK
jgi:hypothetical protein